MLLASQIVGVNKHHHQVVGEANQALRETARSDNYSLTIVVKPPGRHHPSSFELVLAVRFVFAG